MSEHDTSLLEEAKQKHAESVARLDEINARIKALPDDAAADEVEFLRASFEKETSTSKRWAEAAERTQIILEARHAVKPQQVDDGKQQNGDGAAKVLSEPLTYRRGGPHSFFQDMRAASNPSGPDHASRERLQRHAAEMRVEMRDLTTSTTAGGEFVPPTYLQAQWIPLLRAARPTADAVQSFPLQAGTMSYNLPKLTGGAATAIQASDNAAVQETDPTTNIVTANVKTIAGQVDVSRQLFEFSNPGIDEILFRDLARDYATKLDIQVVSGSGSSGQALGIRNVSGINAVAAGGTATAVALWPKVTDAIQRITSAYMNPDTIVMHPRRAGFWLAAVDSQNRPLFNAGAPQNAMGEISGTVANGFAGGLQGMRVVIDPNIPTNVGTNTNEDVMIVFDSNQLYLWEEGAPRTRVFEDIGSGTLTVRLSCFGFFAFMGNRLPASISVISGAALVTPAF